MDAWCSSRARGKELETGGNVPINGYETGSQAKIRGDGSTAIILQQLFDATKSVHDMGVKIEAGQAVQVQRIDQLLNKVKEDIFVGLGSLATMDTQVEIVEIMTRLEANFNSLAQSKLAASSPPPIRQPSSEQPPTCLTRGPDNRDQQLPRCAAVESLRDTPQLETTPSSNPCQDFLSGPAAMVSLRDDKCASKLREELSNIQQSFLKAIQQFDSASHGCIGDKANRRVVVTEGDVSVHLVPMQSDLQESAMPISDNGLLNTLASKPAGHDLMKESDEVILRPPPLSSPRSLGGSSRPELDTKSTTMSSSSTTHDIKSLDGQLLSSLDTEVAFDLTHTLNWHGTISNFPLDLVKAAYHVEDNYCKEGCPQAIARSDVFANIMLAVIIANSIYIGVDADLNNEAVLYNASWAIIFSENLFCVVFCAEWLCRFLAFRHKKNAFKDSWFRFDSFLVLMMVLETWVVAPILYALNVEGGSLALQPIRLVRLLRLSRVGKIIRHVPELVTMAVGLKKGARACVGSLGMIFILTYIYAVALHSLLKDDHVMNAMLWESIGMEFSRLMDCMWLLLVCGTFMLDGTPTVMNELYYTWDFSHQVACVVFVSFLFLSAMVVCNMLIGILCEIVTEVARDQRDASDLAMMKESILLYLKEFDDGDGLISKSELDKVMNTPHSKVVLAHLNVDRTFLMALQQMFFKKIDEVPIKSVMELMLTCRGDQPATVHTVANSLSYLASTMVTLEKHIVRLSEGRMDRHSTGASV